MNNVDKIARDICWADQTKARRAGKTKTAFWLGLTEEARDGYREIARRFAHLLHVLPVSAINLAHDIRGKG